MVLYRLDSPIRHYDWGSPTVIPELLGIAPDDQPAAELWMGAHSAAPSLIAATAPASADAPSDAVVGRSLADVIGDDPRHNLGSQLAARYGPTLPFLLKVLAVERPLSLQAHPSARQAKAGFAAENAAGVALDAAQRNYKDANHKPEMICALTSFEGLCGFRPVAATVQFWTALGAPSLLALRDRLSADGGIRDVVTHLLTMPPELVRVLVEEVTGAARRLADTDDAWSPHSGWLVRLDNDYPGDRGVVLASLLNLFHLEPGEALFLGAGQLHAYLHGTGVELMASSDNVLRGGLTGKHVDVAELVRILEFSESVPAVEEATGTNSASRTYPEHCPDFILSRLELGPDVTISRPAGRPQIVFCFAGAAEVSEAAADGSVARSDAAGADAQMALHRGGAVFVPASDAVVLARGAPKTTVFVATTAFGGQT